MDKSFLDLGYSHASRKTLTLVDLDVHVWGLEECANSTLPIGVVFATHGRCDSAKNMAPFVSGMLGEVARLAKESGRKRTRDLLVITLDHRNHGTRLRDKNTNLAYDKNPQHFIDMTATVYGATQDLDLIMTFLPAYLFPNGERHIEEYMATGISLGGNTTWRQLRADPRIRIAAPIIGLPFEAYGPYLGARAENSGLAFKAPTYPDSLRGYIESPTPEGAYKGKKILTIHGEVDELVPYRFGEKTIADIQRAAPEGEVEVFVQEGKGHECTAEMLVRASEWFWRWGLSKA